MTHGDDIMDLLGRYATGSLTEQERQRLFDAALSDQDLFEELAREQELKMLLDEPGARERMIRALQKPGRTATWILSGAIAAAMSVVAIAFLMRSTPKPPPQVAIATTPTLNPIAPAAAPANEPTPAPRRVEKTRVFPPKSAVDEARPEPAAAPSTENARNAPGSTAPARDEEKKEEPKKKDTDEARPATAAPVAPAPIRASEASRLLAPRQQNPVGGPRQQQVAVQARAAGFGGAADQKATSFGFHYSLDTKGHLIIVAGADGYLFVTSNDGTVLFARKQIAAAITTDIVVPNAVKTITITFATDAAPVQAAPVEHAPSNGEVEGTSPLAIRLRMNP
ncbi:MAG TPA: hypothetical protein VK752_05495 [Bryobacteraceae bacterium]|jgi:hypothetical protein|nr:hypothetical protein [Bryobacteraceae bacterium]